MSSTQDDPTKASTQDEPTMPSTQDAPAQPLACTTPSSASLAHLDWPESIQDSRWLASVTATLENIDWAAMCATALRARRDGLSCRVLPDYTFGGRHVVRLLEFDDGTRWLARVRTGSKFSKSDALEERIEVDTIEWLHQACAGGRAPVPRVFAHALPGDAADKDDANAVYTLLEFFPANILANEAKRHNAPKMSVETPPQFVPALHRSMAAAHVRIASARLPQIGSVVRQADGSFAAGPIPGIGGPFDTAAEYIQARCAHSLRCRRTKEQMAKLCSAEDLDAIWKGHVEFPARLAALAASGKAFLREGPFPIRHPDLSIGNVLVDDKFEVLSVIDWEYAHTVPWELVDGPTFISSNIPRLIASSKWYDEAGQPVSPGMVRSWVEERDYIDMVREAETEAGTDYRLSNILADKDVRDMASVVHHFEEGKVARYGRAMDHFEKMAGNFREPAEKIEKCSSDER